jgi:hypothetical protein
MSPSRFPKTEFRYVVKLFSGPLEFLMTFFSNIFRNKALFQVLLSFLSQPFCGYFCFSLLRIFKIKLCVRYYHFYIRRSQVCWYLLWLSPVKISKTNFCGMCVELLCKALSGLLVFFMIFFNDIFQTKLNCNINHTCFSKAFSFPTVFVVVFFSNILHNKLKY